VNKNVLIVDLELTCWEEKTDFVPEIIQVGLVEVNIVDRKITREYEIFVKPRETEISEFCTKLTGITKKQVYKQGFEFEKAMALLQKKFGFRNKLVIGWGRDDIALTGQIDEYMNLSYLFGIKHKTNKKFKLEEALKIEGIEFEGKAHNALVDARNTAKLFLKITE